MDQITILESIRKFPQYKPYIEEAIDRQCSEEDIISAVIEGLQVKRAYWQTQVDSCGRIEYAHALKNVITLLSVVEKDRNINDYMQRIPQLEGVVLSDQ